jgi:type II secretory pathway pseudopilin PulG
LQRKSDQGGLLEWKPVHSRGINAVEVLVVIMILGVLVLVLAMWLPRQRETARLARCRKNLMHIGVALAVYDQTADGLPEITRMETEAANPGPGPLRRLLETLGQPDLGSLNDPKEPPPRQPNLTITERPIPGFVCPSDSHAAGGFFRAPISYRATTGSLPEGRDGAFAPGRRTRLAEIEAADGLGYTAAFSERLVGNALPSPATFNYAVNPGRLVGEKCPPADPTAWRGDAGSSWFDADWRSTLYNHVLTPNASPSCIADDRRSALMGASSGHLGGVNVLILDGSVRTYSPRVDPRVWRDLASVLGVGGSGLGDGENQREGAATRCDDRP